MFKPKTPLERTLFLAKNLCNIVVTWIKSEYDFL